MIGRPRRDALRRIIRDLTAGTVVFLVALPLCLGIALASDAPPLAGIVAGIVGGLVVGSLSGSQTSVSGPAAGLTAVVAVQIAALGSFPAFLTAVVLAGVVQIGLGSARAGVLADFFPSGVIKGLLAAIGLILILKQFPYVVGVDPSTRVNWVLFQSVRQNPFSDLLDLLDHFNAGSFVIGMTALAILIGWDSVAFLKKWVVPSPLIVVVLGVLSQRLLNELGGPWVIGPSYLVQLPIFQDFADLVRMTARPDWSALYSPAVYSAAGVVAVVASLETLLNLEAVDKLDPEQRATPPNRELFAQGVGNIVSGLFGGLPVTAVIVRGSVNVTAGGRTKLSAIWHGVLLLVCVWLVPGVLNQIPLSCLAAILMVTGFKLASPKLFVQMWKAGSAQYLPFLATVFAILFTDLLIGVGIGLVVSLGFIIFSNYRRPARVIHEKHLSGDLVRIELANQLSFLNRGSLTRLLNDVPSGGHVLFDARNTDYIDPDILGLIRDFQTDTAPARGVQVSLLGFESSYVMEDRILFVDYSTREIQNRLTPHDVLQILKDGNHRFRTGQRLNRDLGRDVLANAGGQFPIAAVLSCIDSRSPAEILFDVGAGDIFSIRIAGNVARHKVLGSLEYACAVAGSKLIVVMGHTNCGAVSAAVACHFGESEAGRLPVSDHLNQLLGDIRLAIPPGQDRPKDRTKFVDEVARQHVRRTIRSILRCSAILDRLNRDGTIAVAGGLYDVRTGSIEFFEPMPPSSPAEPEADRVEAET